MEGALKGTFQGSEEYTDFPCGSNIGVFELAVNMRHCRHQKQIGWNKEYTLLKLVASNPMTIKG